MNLQDLNAYITAFIKANGNKEITGDVLQDVLKNITNSINAWTGKIGAGVVESFPAWSKGEEYDGGVKVLRKHEKQLYEYVSPNSTTGVVPGTNAQVWKLIELPDLAHVPGADSTLAKNTVNEVSASQLWKHLHDDEIHFKRKTFSKQLTVLQVYGMDNVPVLVIPKTLMDVAVLGVKLFVRVLPGGSADYNQPLHFRWTNGDPVMDIMQTIEIPNNSLFVREIHSVDSVANYTDRPFKEGVEVFMMSAPTRGDHEIEIFGEYWEKSLN